MSGITFIEQTISTKFTFLLIFLFIFPNGYCFRKWFKTSDAPVVSSVNQSTETSVYFTLFTRNFPSVNLTIGDSEGFRKSGFNISNPTKIVIHGFLSSINEEVFLMIKKAYLQTGHYNVIGVDWSVLCEFEYLSAMRGVVKAGSILSYFVHWLYKQNVSLDDVHLIGHSMGAHVAGVGGYRLKGRIGRITGLDPAGPGYMDMKPEFKLDRSDAKLVDAIHTYMKILGLADPLGHVDFYPNGGRFQPGCPDIYDLWRVPESLYCNHARAYYLFEETIRDKGAFKSKKCHTVNDALLRRCLEDTNVFMGQAETYDNGLYYVKTNAKSPYNYQKRVV